MDKAFNPQEHETEIYKLWESTKSFTPEINPDKKPFVISMPPPNVTGKLHIGHALFITLEDIMTRYHRMQGEPTLWVPGTDHAGIATQTVVDKALRKQDINRFQIGREEFVKHVWDWKEKYGHEITEQLRAMGASCDWTRERFTLDEGLSEAVKEAFISLYKKDLIYRGEYIVNWCPKCATAIADDEVEHKEQPAKLYYFKYDHNFPITIATTRPETKLGDTAVAVHPQDDRYKQFIGQEFEIDLDGVKRKIKIIADRSIDKEFGTGAVGLTPAHSMVDWKMAEENGLEKIKVIDERGRMTDRAGDYAGMKALEARKKILEYLHQAGLMEKEDDFINNLSICYRCGGAIEPLPSLQWFVKMKPLAEKARKAVESGEIKILPKRFEKVYFHWMDNIRDWCISRQLWWGHRIPVWYRQNLKSENSNVKSWDLKIYGQDIFNDLKSGKKSIETRAGKPEGAEKYWGDFKPGDQITFTLADEKSDLPIEPLQTVTKNISKVEHFQTINELLEKKNISSISSSTEQDYREWWLNFPEMAERIKKYGIWAIALEEPSTANAEIYVGKQAPEGEGWVQDEDVLDTWFSSGLWPFSTLGWPNDTEDYKYFFPNTVMETGYDILFFWVARMIMMSLELTGKAPFETVYLHGLVRDEQNRKISKSLGNGIDPLELAAKYGTDAVRMGLVVGATAGNDVAVGEGKIKGYRNFSNKLWNISRFAITNLDEGVIYDINKTQLNEQDQKDLDDFAKVKEEVTKYLDNFQFSLAGETLYAYTWHEFADKIIEQSKERLSGGGDQKTAVLSKLIYITKDILKMTHPFMPFVTETIWQRLPSSLKDSKLLIKASWPK